LAQAAACIAAELTRLPALSARVLPALFHCFPRKSECSTLTGIYSTSYDPSQPRHLTASDGEHAGFRIVELAFTFGHPPNRRSPKPGKTTRKGGRRPSHGTRSALRVILPRPRGLLEPCAGRPARTVLRGRGRSNALPLPRGWPAHAARA